MSEAAVRIDDLRFTRGADFELSLPELELPAGQSLAIIGPSGCGKTTLLELLAGILRPRHGRILHGGTDVAALGERARRALRIRTIGLVFQDFELLDHLDARQNVLLPFRLDRSMRLDAAARSRADALLDRMGLDAATRRRRPPSLSQGERQRVGLCRALVTAPSLVLADEPTGNLDPANSRRATDLMLEVTRELGASLVVVTHDHSLLDRFDRVLAMDAPTEAAA